MSFKQTSNNPFQFPPLENRRKSSNFTQANNRQDQRLRRISKGLFAADKLAQGNYLRSLQGDIEMSTPVEQSMVNFAPKFREGSPIKNFNPRAVASSYKNMRKNYWFNHRMYRSSGDQSLSIMLEPGSRMNSAYRPYSKSVPPNGKCQPKKRKEPDD
jgi:hypothetical protein